MKKIEAVFRASDLENVKSGLATVVDAPMIVGETVCCGPSVHEVRVYRGSSYVCDAVPCLWLQAIVDDERLGHALDALRSAVQHGPGHDMGILVSDVERVGALTLSPHDGDGHRAPVETVHEDTRERPRVLEVPAWIGSALQSGAW